MIQALGFAAAETPHEYEYTVDASTGNIIGFGL